jgi:hypothetical protein
MTSKLVDVSSSIIGFSRTPLIWTKAETVPFTFVIVHGGPGGFHPGGVDPGVNHLLVESGGKEEVIPGLKMLLLLAPPYLFGLFPIICSIV